MMRRSDSEYDLLFKLILAHRREPDLKALEEKLSKASGVSFDGDIDAWYTWATKRSGFTKGQRESLKVAYKTYRNYRMVEEFRKKDEEGQMD